jgi:hypothetical protein
LSQSRIANDMLWKICFGHARVLPWMLSDLPSRLYKQADLILAVARIWSDAESNEIFEANIRLRALGDLTAIPGRPVENTYSSNGANSLFKR